MKKNSFALRGNFIYPTSPDTVVTHEHAVLVCENGLITGIFPTLPEQYQGLPVTNYGERLIIPGLTDLHLHAPQYTFRGNGMDLELLDWLEQVAFPEEHRYRDSDYADDAYDIFVDDLRYTPTTRACIFSTLYTKTTLKLMDKLEDTGLICCVGKVNMDRNSPDNYRETDAAASIADTRAWLAACTGYERTQPILTPRFVPSCSDELLHALGALQQETGLPVQSHLSENPSELAWVQTLCPWADNYGDVYDKCGLMPEQKTIMAHCVYSTEAEIALLKARQVYVVHCPQSNMNVSSGIAPIRRYLDEGIPVGLGTDLGAGSNLSLFRAMTDAIMVSKLYWRLIDSDKKPLTLRNAFYLAAKGGGSFFGKVGSFEPGYEFDAVVLDDNNIRTPLPLTLEQRLERIAYLSDERNLCAKFVAGQQVL